MAFAESLRFIDPREVPKPNEETLRLPFGGNALVINVHEVMLWASLVKEPNVPFVSLMLNIATDMRILTRRGIERGLVSSFQPGLVNTLPVRISHNPKRNWFYLEPNYEIYFQDATGAGWHGNLVIRLMSKNPIVTESILRPLDMNGELRRRKAMHSAQNMLR